MTALYLTVIVPVYNNATTLAVLLEKIKQACAEITPRFEIIFVNDASTDSSASILHAFSASHSDIGVITLKKNTGQWEATLLGISRARGEYIVTIDADLQYAPEDIPKLYRHLKENNLLLVYGIPTRMLSGLGGLRNRLQNLSLGKSYTSSFKIFHRSVVFNSENGFIADRHFEAYEKFNLQKKDRSWIQVNTSQLKPGGFRSNWLRNTNILLTYLPEYNLHFRHPLTTSGGFLAVINSCAIVAIISTDYPLKFIIPFCIFTLAGLFLWIAGAKWGKKYARLILDRKKQLSQTRCG